MAGAFFDTSVLVYLASNDATKADRVEALIENGGTISVQVLNEFANVARGKMRLSWPDTRDALATLRALFTVHPVTVETHEAGMALAERYGLSVFDGMIAGAALRTNCDILWSEDMQNGLRLTDSLRIRNPFRAAP